MKKKIWKYILISIAAIITIIAAINAYKWIRSGNQTIVINTAKKVYSNSDMYVTISANKNGIDLETSSRVKLLDSNKREVSGTKVAYNGETCIISIPNVETGSYIIDANVSTKEGNDSVQNPIYISNGNSSNYTITLDKGIYKPGDIVNYRTLITSKSDNKPIKAEVNVCIYDGNNNKVYNENVTTSNYGILSGSFKLADEVNSGIYKLIVKNGQEENTKSFKVNPYITPKYEVKIETDKKNYLVNETANIKISANYFFGQPAAGTKFVMLINDNEPMELMADENGIANYKYEIKSASMYNVKVEAVDSSNYYVEQSANFTAGTDVFEVELFPEYGNLITNQKNNVYIFTKASDGSPVKSYVTINSDTYNKQIVTDDNGIGIFSIDVASSANKRFKITATNMQGEKVNKEITVSCQSTDLLIATDKVKYEQGEDIKINVASTRQNKKNIFFFKNDRLIKSLSTDAEETAANLGDTYGLIDIVITDTHNNTTYTSARSSTAYNIAPYYNSARSSTYRKTIFIKPKNELKIAIKTDKEEYKPGEDIKISFETTEENNNKIDAALLVSMLDNSILSLADNDLSIDNIKLALSDISFTDELDAATLYSCIIDDSSEQAMAALLLKQGYKDFGTSEKRINNSQEKEISAIICICCITVLLIGGFWCLYFKFTKFRKAFKHIANIFIYVVIVSFLVNIIWMECFDNYDFGWIEFISILVICISSYIVLLSKKRDFLFRTTVWIAITAFIVYACMLVYGFVVYEGLPPAIVIGVLAVLIAGFSIGYKFKLFKNFKINWKRLLKFIGAVILSGIAGAIVLAITDITTIEVPIMMIGIYVLNYLFNRKNDQEQDENSESVPIKVFKIIIGTVITCTAIFSIIGIFLLTSRLNRVYKADIWYDYNDTLSIDQGIRFSQPSQSKNTDINILEGISSVYDSVTTNTEQKAEEETVTKNNADQAKKEQSEEKIRNVFLESMCFIPELITSEGKAEANLTLSDNITTWTIQTIGNTLDGRVNYSKLDTVKVFKEFFVDFELPKNLVETDKVSIPVTVYNYTENNISTTLKIKEDEWFKLNRDNTISVNLSAKESKMVYVPIEVLKFGDFKLRIEASSGQLTDIIEKTASVLPNGYKLEKVVSSGTLEGNTSEDILLLEDVIPNTGKAKLKIYASSIAQSVEGMENILRMPSGCFEQISSSLYPDILTLKYLQDNGIVNEELKTKAISYITAGYQKLLTYEVPGEKGGYSLYGDSPAETVLTAYGLMELTDLKEVYNVDENVLKNMRNFLYGKQNLDGSFTITGNHTGGANTSDKLALNAYITWALSESTTYNDNLKKSVEYLKKNLNQINDNYTLALVANCLINVEDSQANDVIKRLVNNININDNSAYITSNIVDYYGCRSSYQDLQTAALTSIALSKSSNNEKINKLLIQYIIGKKDPGGTWHSTQATILCLKALNAMNENSSLENQTIKVKLNSDEKNIEVKNNALEIYEMSFDNLNKENKLMIEMQKGRAYYEVVEEYYIPYEKINKAEEKVEIATTANTSLRVNELLNANIKLTNKSEQIIYNEMITIAIPQGFSVLEESLARLKHDGKIEKYEMNYSYINLYIRSFSQNEIESLDVSFRALYPVSVTGLAVRAYDYYNPQVEGISSPIAINVTQ